MKNRFRERIVLCGESSGPMPKKTGNSADIKNL